MDSLESSSSLGQRLRQAREARQVSLAQAAQATCIRLAYLEALENDQSDRLPSLAHQRGFLRAYAQYLGLNPEGLLSSLPERAGEEPAPAVEQPVQVDSIAEGEAGGIFAELGRQLRQQRQRLGLSLEDVERHTRIRVHNLKALEEGDLRALPSPVQARGMLSNYASFIGMDPEPVLLRFAEGLQADLFSRQARQPLTTPATTPGARQPSPLRRLLSVDLFVTSFLVIFLVAFLSWGALRISNTRASQTPTATAPSIADVLSQPGPTGEPTGSASSAIATPDSEALPPVSEAGATPEPPSDENPPTPTATVFTVTSGSAVQVNIIAHQRAWMRVLVDAEVGFEGRVTPGSVYVFSGSRLVEILTGNGAALQVFYNQQDLGILGILGEVVSRTYLAEGAQTPTPAPATPALPQPTPTLPSGLIFPTPVAP